MDRRQMSTRTLGCCARLTARTVRSRADKWPACACNVCATPRHARDKTFELHTCGRSMTGRRLSGDLGLLNGQQAGDVISGMPEMPTLARAVVTSPPYRVFARRVLVPWMLAGEQPAGEGLEIGAGSGVMSAQLLANVPTLRMVATDYDPHMVHAARRTLRSFGNRADVLQADAADLPFAGGRFDLVMSAAMLHHVPAWQDAVEHAIRVLRPGGRLIGYDPLESAPGRLVHVTERHTTKMLQPGELDAQLNRLAVTNVQVIPALRGTVVRFSATKTN